MEGSRNAPAPVDFERHPHWPLRVTQRAFAVIARTPA
jgi:hypothetical protein